LLDLINIAFPCLYRNVENFLRTAAVWSNVSCLLAPHRNQKLENEQALLAHWGPVATKTNQQQNVCNYSPRSSLLYFICVFFLSLVFEIGQRLSYR